MSTHGAELQLGESRLGAVTAWLLVNAIGVSPGVALRGAAGLSKPQVKRAARTGVINRVSSSLVIPKQARSLEVTQATGPLAVTVARNLIMCVRVNKCTVDQRSVVTLAGSPR